MMAKIKRSDVLYRKRRKVLNYARDLARSGEHADHQTIILHLAHPPLGGLGRLRGCPKSVRGSRHLCAARQALHLCPRGRTRIDIAPIPARNGKADLRGVASLETRNPP